MTEATFHLFSCKLLASTFSTRLRENAKYAIQKAAKKAYDNSGLEEKAANKRTTLEFLMNLNCLTSFVSLIIEQDKRRDPPLVMTR